jgi:hypothetical protein
MGFKIEKSIYTIIINTEGLHSRRESIFAVQRSNKL